MKTFKRQTMNWKGLVFITTMLFMVGSGVIFAKKEKPGATLIVQKKGGETIQGELLSVKDGTLTLLIYGNASKVYVQLTELSSLRIVKKDAFGKGLLTGALIGGGFGALLGFASGNDESHGGFMGDFMVFTAGQKALGLGGILGLAGGVIGGIAGAVSGIDKFIELDHVELEKLIQVEVKLTSLARYRTNPIAKPWKTSLKENKITSLPSKELPTAVAFSSAQPERKVICHWHISIIPGIFHSQGANKFCVAIKENEFISNAHWVHSFYVDQAETKDYTHLFFLFFLKNIQVEYSLTKKLSIGLLYAPLGKYQIWGSRGFEGNDNLHGFVYLGGRFGGDSFILTAAFMPLPDAFLKNSMLKLGAGIGCGSIKGAFLTSLEVPYSEEDEKTPYYQVKKCGFARQALAMMVFAESNYFFNRHISFGLNIHYKYVPFRTDACQLITPYNCWCVPVSETITVNVPELRINAGGFGAGINFGFHF